MPEQGGQAGKHGFQFRIELQHIFLFRQCFGLFDVQGKGHLVIAFGFPVPGGQGAGLEINLRFQVQAAGQFINMGHGPFRGPCGKHGGKWGYCTGGGRLCAPASMECTAVHPRVPFRRRMVQRLLAVLPARVVPRGDFWGGQVPESGGACSGAPFRARMIWAGYGVNRRLPWLPGRCRLRA